MRRALRRLVLNAKHGRLCPQNIGTVDVRWVGQFELRAALMSVAGHQPDAAYLVISYHEAVAECLGAKITHEIRAASLRAMTRMSAEVATLAAMDLDDNELIALCGRLELRGRNGEVHLTEFYFVVNTVNRNPQKARHLRARLEACCSPGQRPGRLIAPQSHFPARVAS